MNIVFRPYASEDDYAAIRDIIVRKFEEPNRRFYPSLGDLDYNRSFGGEEFLEKLVFIELEDNARSLYLGLSRRSGACKDFEGQGIRSTYLVYVFWCN